MSLCPQAGARACADDAENPGGVVPPGRDQRAHGADSSDRFSVPGDVWSITGPLLHRYMHEGGLEGLPRHNARTLAETSHFRDEQAALPQQAHQYCAGYLQPHHLLGSSSPIRVGYSGRFARRVATAVQCTFRSDGIPSSRWGIPRLCMGGSSPTVSRRWQPWRTVVRSAPCSSNSSSRVIEPPMTPHIRRGCSIPLSAWHSNTAETVKR